MTIDFFFKLLLLTFFYHDAIQLEASSSFFNRSLQQNEEVLRSSISELLCTLET
jgi:hypothetical protein